MKQLARFCKTWTFNRVHHHIYSCRQIRLHRVFTVLQLLPDYSNCIR